jgi:hypothetical protein
MNNPMAVADSAMVDSAFLNMAMREAPADYSMSNVSNGQLVSAVMSRLYFDRTRRVDDIFGMHYDPYTITPQTVRY